MEEHIENNSFKYLAQKIYEEIKTLIQNPNIILDSTKNMVEYKDIMILLQTNNPPIKLS